MNIKIEQDSQILEKIESLYFNIEQLFYELDETKKFELTPYIAKRLYDILAKYNDVKTELIKTYNEKTISRNIKYDQLTPMFHLIIDALTLSQSLYHELLLNNSVDIETMFVLDNVMSRIQRTILFFHYFNFVL